MILIVLCCLGDNFRVDISWVNATELYLSIGGLFIKRLSLKQSFGWESFDRGDSIDVSFWDTTRDQLLILIKTDSNYLRIKKHISES